MVVVLCFFFNDTATTEIYTLSLHDALPILARQRGQHVVVEAHTGVDVGAAGAVEVELDQDLGLLGLPLDPRDAVPTHSMTSRSEEHTSELQSRQYLVCRLLLEKKTYTTLHT